MKYNIQTTVKKALEVDPRIRSYSTFSEIVASTNEDLVDSYSTIEVQNESLLIPAYGGDQFLTSKMLGANHVMLYDINLLTKHFTFLKIGAYKYFNDFNSFQQFIVPRDGNSNFLNTEDFRKITGYLPIKTATFWYLFLKKCSDKQLYNILPPISDEHFEHLKNFTPFYSDEGYEKYKKLVDSLKYPEFILSDLRNLPNNIPNDCKKFDLIDCSNIIECEIFKSLQHFFSPSWYLENELEYEWIVFIQDKLSKLLSANGKIIVDYRLHAASGLEAQHDFLFNHPELISYLIDSNYPESKSAISVYQKK